MRPYSQNDTFTNQASKILDWIAPRLNKFETILAVLFAITLLGKMCTDFPTGVLMVMVLEALAILYFFSAFPASSQREERGLKIFIHKLTFWCCSIIVIGILFRLQFWPGYNTMLLVAPAALLVSLTVILFMKSGTPEWEIFNTRFMLRILIIAIIGLLLRLTPAEDLIKYGVLKTPKTQREE